MPPPGHPIAVIVRHKGGRDVLIQTRGGFPASKASEASRSFAVTMDSHISTKGASDIDGSGDAALGFTRGTVLVSQGRYHVVYQLVYSVYVLVAIPAPGNVFIPMHLMENVVKMLISVCKGPEVTPERLLRKYSTFYMSLDVLLGRWGGPISLATLSPLDEGEGAGQKEGGAGEASTSAGGVGGGQIRFHGKGEARALESALPAVRFQLPAEALGADAGTPKDRRNLWTSTSGAEAWALAEGTGTGGATATALGWGFGDVDDAGVSPSPAGGGTEVIWRGGDVDGGEGAWEGSAAWAAFGDDDLFALQGGEGAAAGPSHPQEVASAVADALNWGVLAAAAAPGTPPRGGEDGGAPGGAGGGGQGGEPFTTPQRAPRRSNTDWGFDSSFHDERRESIPDGWGGGGPDWDYTDSEEGEASPNPFGRRSPDVRPARRTSADTNDEWGNPSAGAGGQEEWEPFGGFGADEAGNALGGSGPDGAQVPGLRPPLRAGLVETLLGTFEGARLRKAGLVGEVLLLPPEHPSSSALDSVHFRLANTVFARVDKVHMDPNNARVVDSKAGVMEGKYAGGGSSIVLEQQQPTLLLRYKVGAALFAPPVRVRVSAVTLARGYPELGKGEVAQMLVVQLMVSPHLESPPLSEFVVDVHIPWSNPPAKVSPAATWGRKQRRLLWKLGTLPPGEQRMCRAVFSSEEGGVRKLQRALRGAEARVRFLGAGRTHTGVQVAVQPAPGAAKAPDNVAVEHCLQGHLRALVGRG